MSDRKIRGLDKTKIFIDRTDREKGETEKKNEIYKWNTKGKKEKIVCEANLMYNAVRLREPGKGLMWGILPSQEL